jgi:hypothetical protein
MNFIKKNIFKISIGLVILVFLLVFGYVFLSLIYPSSEETLYGTRLKNLQDFPITNEMIDTLKAEITENENVMSVSYNLNGRIINLIIKFKENTDIVDAKEIEAVILDNFNEDLKSYYDIQVFLTNEVETTEYPAIGYKHHTNETFKWTNYNVKVIEDER